MRRLLDRVLVFNASDTPTAVAHLNNITIAALAGIHGERLKTGSFGTFVI